MSDHQETKLAFQAGSVRTTIDVKVYRLVAVQKAAYKFADRCTVIIGELDRDSVPLTFRFAANVAEGSALETVRLFFQELLDQELREHIGDETRAMRSLILAHAFSKTDLIRRE